MSLYNRGINSMFLAGALDVSELPETLSNSVVSTPTLVFFRDSLEMAYAVPDSSASFTIYRLPPDSFSLWINAAGLPMSAATDPADTSPDLHTALIMVVPSADDDLEIAIDCDYLEQEAALSYGADSWKSTEYKEDHLRYIGGKQVDTSQITNSTLWEHLLLYVYSDVDTTYYPDTQTVDDYLLNSIIRHKLEFGYYCSLDADKFDFVDKRRELVHLSQASKLFPGYPTQIVYLADSVYGQDTPDNLWPCDGSLITNKKAVASLAGRTAPHLGGKVLAGPTSDHFVGSVAGAESFDLLQANMPDIPITLKNVSFTPRGTVSSYQDGHSHSAVEHIMYKVHRSGSDIDSNDASIDFNSSNNSGTIETGKNDRVTFYWATRGISMNSVAAGVHSTFSGEQITLSGLSGTFSAGSQKKPVSCLQPTAYINCYIVIY